jgi:hypothetical protein
LYGIRPYLPPKLLCFFLLDPKIDQPAYDEQAKNNCENDPHTGFHLLSQERINLSKYPSKTAPDAPTPITGAKGTRHFRDL